MYEVDDNDQIVELENVPQSSIGTPVPIVLAGEHNVILAYYVEAAPEGWNGTSVRISDSNSEGESVAIITFDRCYAHLFGPPNDETFDGHPLSNRGLRPYHAFEVKDSSWIRNLETMNSVHSSHVKDRFMKNKRHFIFSFHDTTFECIAEGFSVEPGIGPIKRNVPRMLDFLR